MSETLTDDVAAMCGAHLREEERLLAAALPIVRTVQHRFNQREPGPLPELVQHQHELTQLIGDMQQRRHLLRAAIAHRLNLVAGNVRLAPLVNGMPPSHKDALLIQLVRVRQLADELVATNHRLSLHLHIYLDAYQRLLQDLTGTPSASGRYGPQGKADVPQYRPMIQVHG